MSVRQGNKIIAGQPASGVNLFDFKWADHRLDDMSWLRADTFSWHSGDVYVAAYEHLAADMENLQKHSVQLYGWEGGYYTASNAPAVGDIAYLRDDFNQFGGGFYAAGTVWSYTAGNPDKITVNLYSGITGVGGNRIESVDTIGEIAEHAETIGDITIIYYKAQDGHKVCLPNQEYNLIALYKVTGVAWYYLLDTENKQFKLPRTKWGFVGLRGSLAAYIAAGAPNITGVMNLTGISNSTTPRFNSNNTAGSALYNTESIDVGKYHTDSSNGNGYNRIRLDASRSSSVYGNSDTVQPPATQMYLYFYVGNFEREALKQTAGLNAELFNGKADVDLGNVPANYDYVVESQSPTASNGYTWYRKYKSGWVEQGGTAASGSSSVTFPVEFANTGYYFNANLTAGGNASTGHIISSGYGTTSCTLKEGQYQTAARALTNTAKWFACGMAA